MNSKLTEAIEDFITQRMDDHGTNAPEEVSEAITQVGACLSRLEKRLTKTQRPLFQQLENALMLQVGEEMRYYYRAGFCDAVKFMLEWSGTD